MNIHEMDEHSIVGPSSLSAIILCPGRVRMQRGIEDKTSFPAAQGTVAHAVGENRLDGKRFPKTGKIITQDGHEIEVDQDMINAVKVYVEHVAELRSVQCSDRQESIEDKVSLSHLGIPDVYGTVDYALSIPFQTLYVRDYKHGAGVIVDAENNPQLMAYALGAAGPMIETYETINMGIVQPRGRDGQIIKVWETTPEHLLSWAEDVLKPTVELALSDEAPLNPGEKQCKWCRAKDICPALAKDVVKTAQADFKEFAGFIPDRPDILSIQDIENIYPKLKLISDWVKAIESRVFNELATGGVITGYKLVKGRKSRTWENEIKAAFVLKNLGVYPYELKLLTPAKAEKLLDKAAKKEVQGIIETSEGKPSIVKETDKREAITTASEDFKNYKKD